MMGSADFGLYVPIVFLTAVVIAIVGVVLWSWLSSSHGSVCCRNCREIIPNPGELGQCRSCGFFYDEAGRTVGEPGIVAGMTKLDLDRFRPTDNAANDERLQREPGYKETRDA
jgi:hypothetical protein